MKLHRALSWLGRFVVAQAWPLAIFAAALAVRLHWNLVVHPPGDYVYSDMNGYVSRAQELWTTPLRPREYSGFYPYGTHMLVFAVQKFGAFWDVGVQKLLGVDPIVEPGPKDLGAVGVAWALIGALVAMFGYLMARRCSKYPGVAAAVGLVLIVDYPLISLGGYVLSEVPFALGLVVGTWLLFRVVDEGRKRDAWLAGVAIAFAVAVRPQILLSVAVVTLVWVAVRRQVPKLTFPMLVRAGLPVLLLLGFSAVRLHYHTERWGLIAENGTFNQVYGRCHNVKIIALGPGRSKTSFGPPPLIQLAQRSERNPDAWPQLEPVLEKDLYYHGYIGDAEILRGFMKDCVARTGLVKQLEFALVHVVMLWQHNVLWPDSGKGQWQGLAAKWGLIHLNTLAWPAILAMLVVFVPRRHPKLALAAAHLWALFVVAALHFGDVRLRAPYDPVIALLAFEFLAGAGVWAWHRVRRNLGPRPRVQGECPGPSPGRAPTTNP